MELLAAHFETRAAFLDGLGDRHGKCSLVVATGSSAAAGDQVMAEIDVPGIPNAILARAVVGERRSGSLVLWISALDRAAVLFAARCARGEDLEVTPRAARLPASLPVDCQLGAAAPTWLASQTVDVSASGVFVRAKHAPASGTPVRLVIGPTPSGEHFLVYGHTAEARPGGFGVHFASRGESDARRLRAVLRRGTETGKVAFSI